MKSFKAWLGSVVVLGVTLVSVAASAITVTITDLNVIGNKREVYGTIAFDSSYPTGGETLTPATLGLSVVQGFEVTGDPYGGNVYNYNTSTDKLQVFNSVVSGTSKMGATTDSGGEINNAQSLTGLTVYFRALGL